MYAFAESYSKITKRRRHWNLVFTRRLPARRPKLLSIIVRVTNPQKRKSGRPRNNHLLTAAKPPQNSRVYMSSLETSLKKSLRTQDRWIEVRKQVLSALADLLRF